MIEMVKTNMQSENERFVQKLFANKANSAQVEKNLRLFAIMVSRKIDRDRRSKGLPEFSYKMNPGKARRLVERQLTVETATALLKANFYHQIKYRKNETMEKTLVRCAHIQKDIEWAFGFCIDPYKTGIYRRSEVTCPCGCKAELQLSIYGAYWLCPECGASVGCHYGTNIPYGNLADSRTRKSRIEAHEAFDDFCIKTNKTTTQAYHWLSEKMKIPERKVHFGKFSEEECRRAITLMHNISLI